MIKYLKSLFTSKDIAEMETKSIMTLDQMIRSQSEIMRPELGSTYSDNSATGDFREWVYVAANHNAKTVADSMVKLYSTIKPKVSNYKQLKPNYYQIENHPIIDLLNKPNNNDSLYSFLYKIDIFLELTGDVYILIIKDERGIPIGLEILYSQFVNIQTDGLNRVIGYNYGVAQDGRYQYQLPFDDVIHIKFFNPDDILYGISPLEAAYPVYQMTKSMNIFENALSRNLGIPAGILKYNTQRIKDDDRKVIENKWQQKFASVGRAGKILVTDSDMDFTSLGIVPRDMQFESGRKYSREEIFACYGVPMALLLTEGVNRSNMVEASLQYHNNTIKPRLKLIAQSLNRELLDKYGINKGNLEIEFSRELPKDNETIFKFVDLLSKNKALTINELRESAGYERVDGGDILFKEEIINEV